MYEKALNVENIKRKMKSNLKKRVKINAKLENVSYCTTVLSKTYFSGDFYSVSLKDDRVH